MSVTMVSTTTEVDTMEEVKRAPRRAHSAEFRSRVLAKCRPPCASVAMAHGLNANLVRKWKQATARGSASRALGPGNKDSGEFVALALPPQENCSAKLESRANTLASNASA